jgi:YHS domain-containing protein
MDVEPANAPEKANYQGKSYSFCSAECKEQFDQNPAQYARPEFATKR